MKFKKMLSGLLACALAVTSAFAGNVSTVKAVEPAADGAAVRAGELQAGKYYIVNAAQGGFLNGGNSWGTQASALPYGELMEVVYDGGKTYLKYGTYYLKDGYLDGSSNERIALSIEPCEDGSYTIAKEDRSAYLTASADNTVVAFAALDDPDEPSGYAKWRFLTREEFITEVTAVSSDDGVDVTSLIGDAAFTRNNSSISQWKNSLDTKTAPTIGPNENHSNYCAEYYQKKFNLSQTIENIPNGIYELNVQGLYRGTNPGIYYINGTEHQLKNLDDENSKPSTAKTAATSFLNGGYMNTPIRTVVTNGTLTVGIKAAKADTAVDWVTWDNFTLMYIPTSDKTYQESLDKIEKPSILGTNQGYQRIRSNLVLPTDASKMLDGINLSIKWTSSNTNAIGNDGTIQENAKNGDTAVMTAKLSVAGSTVSKEWTYPARIAKSVALGESNTLTYDFNDGLNGAAVLDGATWQLKDYEGEVTYAAGRSNANGDKALSMDGSYGLELPHYNLGDTWTVSMWYCPKEETDIATNSQLFFAGYHDPQKWIGIAGKDGDTASYKIWSQNLKATDSGVANYDKIITPQKGKWNMLTITQGADKQISVYDNGVLVVKSTDYTLPVLSGNSQTIYLGTNFWDLGFKGLIDDVTVSNKALTDQEAAEEYLKSATAEDFKNGLQKQILGENKSPQRVTKDLTLPNTYLGKTLTWKNSNDKALTINGTKATVAAKGKLPESTTLTYELADTNNGKGTIAVQAGTEENFDRQEFYNKTEDEQKDHIKAEIKKVFLNGNLGMNQVASDLKLLQKVSYKTAVIAGITWSSSDEAKINTTETAGTGKVKYNQNLSEKVTLTATVSPDDGAATQTDSYPIPFNVKVAKPDSVAPTDMGNTQVSYDDKKNPTKTAGNTKTSNKIEVGVTTTSDAGSQYCAPRIKDVSYQTGPGANVGSDRPGYLVFDLASLLKGSAGSIDWNTFNTESIEYATLKLHINSVNANLGDNNKMKVGLYPVESKSIEGITAADPDTYPAAKNTADESENAYDKDHVTWCAEWLAKTDTNRVITFDVKKLVLAAAKAKQAKIAFRLQVPTAQVVIAGLTADEANRPSLSVQFRKAYTDAEKIEEDILALDSIIIPDNLSEDCNLTLPAEIGDFKSTVTWTSNNDTVKFVKDEANKTYKVKVTRPTDRDAAVTITAKVTNGTAESQPMTFTTKVDKYMTNADLLGKLIANFNFDDATDGTKGNGAIATKNGAANINYNTDGKFGKAVKLGANTWLEVTKEDNSALLKGKEEITVSYYSKSNFAQTGHGSWTFFAARDGKGISNNSQRHYLALLDAKNAMKSERFDGNSGHSLEKTELENEWRKVDLVVYKDKTILYIDGVKAAEESDSTQKLTNILGADGGVIYIGKGTWGSGEYYDGLLDEYKIYDRALTANEVSRMYQRDETVLDAETKLAQAKEDLTQPEILTEDGVDTVTFTDTVSQENCSIRWTIPEMQGKIEVLEAGKKIKLIRGNSAVTFKVTATITYHNEDVEKSVTKEFEIEIPKIGDKTATEKARDDVNAAKTELETNGLTVGENDKITLPQADSADKCTITWTAPEDSAVEISQNGKTATVTRGDEEAQVTLTAHITHKTQTSIKGSVDITVTIPALTPEQKAERNVAAAKAALEAPVINADNTITFKTEDTEHNCTIAWTTTNSAVKISEDGKTATVTRGTSNQNVRLTATITSKTVTTVSDTKSLTIIIPKELPQEIKALLEEAIADNKEDVKDAYTEESYQKYLEAYEALKALSLKTDLTTAEIEAATAAVKTAAEGLVVKDEYKPSEAQKKALGDAVTDAAALQSKDYVQDNNWKAFQAALKKAQAISSRSNATKDQVKNATDELTAAKAKLTKAVTTNKTELNKAIAAANKLNQKDYTAATWKNFQAALNNAKSVSSKNNATQKEINDALNNLKAKQKALKKLVTKLTVTDKTSGSKSPKIAAGKKVTLKVTAAPAGASSSATFSIAKKQQKYAKVSSKGVVTTKKAGAGKTVTVTVTAKDGSKKKTTIKIKIMKNAVTKISLKAAKKVKAGKAVTIKAAIKTNGKKANKSLIWSIDKKSAKYASINSKGKLTTKKSGKGKKVTVTAASTDGTNKKAKVTITLTK